MRFEDVNTNVNVKAVEKEDTTIYTEIDNIPSKYKMYPTNVKLSGRGLTLLEVKKLSHLNEENSDSLINETLKRCIKGYPIDKLLSADKMYLIFWLRANTYREAGYSVSFTCPKCSEESSYDFTLNNLQVKELSDSFSLDKLNVITKSGKTFKFHFTTVEDEKQINKFKIAYADIIKEIDDDFITNAVMIDEINGEKLDILEKYNYVINLTPEEYSFLISRMEEYNFGIKSFLNATCNKCGGVSPVGVTFQEDFFIPRYTSN
jgi:hypothetical protein